MLIALLLAASAPAFDPLVFFAGQTRGTGQLKVVLHRAVSVRVRGHGTVQPDGSLVLDQIVEEGAKPARKRQWHLRRTTAGHYEGSLSDALGPVAAETDGTRLHLRFATPSGYRIQQWLTLSPDGRSAENVLVARRFGVTVAKLREQIVKID